MTMYIHYNKDTNKFSGFYDSDIHTVIPLPNKSLSNDQYKLAFDLISSNKSVVVDGVEIIPEVLSTIPVTWNSIRSKRNRKLINSDYTQLLDYPGNREEWALYRQQLRDIPQRFTDPSKVIWPTNPEVKL